MNTYNKMNNCKFRTTLTQMQN